MTELLPLAAVPAGADVLVDARIFVYALNKQSPQCEAVLIRFAREEAFGVTIFDVVTDVTNRLMLAEAVSEKLI